MQIEQLTFGNEAALNLFYREYNDQKHAGLINPSLIDEMEEGYVEYENSGLLVAKGQQGNIRGILHYLSFKPRNFSDFEIRLFPEFTSERIVKKNDCQASPGFSKKMKGIKSYTFKESLLSLSLIDCFPKSQGTGKKLVEKLKSLEDVEGVFVEPCGVSLGFILN